MEWLYENWNDVIFTITSVVTAASVVVKFTPSKMDDLIVSRILQFISLAKRR